MKASDVGGTVGLLIWMHLQLVDCSGAIEDERLEQLGMENHRGMKSLKPSRCSCATACAMDVDCDSFGYDLHTRICFLRNIVYGNTDIADDMCKCHDAKCSLGLGLRCQVFRRHQPYVPVHDERPDVMRARRQVSNGAATYTCEHPDFKVCLNKTTSVCQCTGTLVNWNGMCGRFRWSNPRTYYPLYLPCGSWTEFSVTIRGTPNNDSRFDVYVRNDKVAVFYVDFRFKFGYEHHCILCNTFINDEWGTEDHGGVQTLQIGKPCSVTIILRDGMYRVVVDGKQRCTIPEKRRGAQPEYIVIEHDVTVHSVEITV